MSILKVDTLQPATASGVNIAGHVIQVHYNTPASGQNMTDIAGQSSVTINNTTVRGTTSVSFSRQDANSFFLVQVGATVARASTSGEMRMGYRLNSGSDQLAYIADNESWQRVDPLFKDTTTGNVGDTVTFESVIANTAATGNYARHVMMCVWEVAQLVQY